MSVEVAAAVAPASGSKLLVLDFDGTMTDAEQEGLPFRQSYLEDMQTLCAKDFQELDELARKYEEIASHCDTGWVINGRIVAPSSVDPYLRMNNIARRIFNDLGLFQCELERARVLELLYKYSYLKTGMAFHPGAREAFEHLKGTATFVVTNSLDKPVKRKLESLGRGEDGGRNSLDWLLDRVNGNAKKFELDESLDAVPESMHLPGLSRPVFLRRKQYYLLLKRLMDEVGCSWQELVVVGDIFELDLALPFAMGARVGLMANAYTPAYEREFLERSEHGRVLDGVHQIPEFAFGMACCVSSSSSNCGSQQPSRSGEPSDERAAKAQRR